MNVTYFKRFKMELDLNGPLPTPVLPEGYFWLPWDESLLEAHAEVKYASFHDEIDAAVFPSLSNRNGCFNLMREISRKHGFLPWATWLIGSTSGHCGTVQG